MIPVIILVFDIILSSLFLSVFVIQVVQKGRGENYWRPSKSLWSCVDCSRAGFRRLGHFFGVFGNSLNRAIALVNFGILQESFIELVNPLVQLAASPYQIVLGYLYYLRDLAWTSIATMGFFYGTVIGGINLALRYYFGIGEPLISQIHFGSILVFVSVSIFLRLRVYIYKRENVQNE